MHNVHIKHYKKGRLLEERKVHNSWVQRGRTYLTKIVGESFIFMESRRLKYMSLGMGGLYADARVFTPPLAAPHPPGDQAGNSLEPKHTSGNEYRSDYLEGSGDGTVDPYYTLELPARVTGTSPPENYDTAAAAGTDTWYIGPPNLYFSIVRGEALAVHAFVDASLGEYVYSTLEEIPVTEAGLHLSDIDINRPYEPLVAYVNFGTIEIDANSRLEIIWEVRFSP